MGKNSNYVGNYRWEAGLQFLVVLLAGVILGLFASVYLKKRDEVTRVCGDILEKRGNSHG